MPQMTERELLALVDAEFSSAMGAPDGEISTERALAWDYYLSKPFGDEVEGQSSVVTSDVSDVVDSIMPPLLRLFMSDDNLVAFDPVGPEDEALAEQETDYVNYVFRKQNDAFMVLYTWFFDALVQKNGIVKCWVSEDERVTTETYSGLTQDQLFSLLSDEELEPVERSEAVVDGITLFDVQCKRVSKKKRFVVDNVPPDEYRISSDARHLSPSKARMVGQERDMRRADLLAMGFDAEVVNSLPASAGTLSNEKQSRHNRSEEDDSSAFDRSQDLITVREAYVWCDYEGKGRAELRKVFTSNGKMLEHEPADSQPFHVISPQPLPHKHFGRATAEKVMDVQRVGSTLTRQVLDNLYHTNNPGHAVWEQGISENTLDDLLTRRVGGVTRFDRPPAESWAPMTVPFTAASTFPMIEYFDKVKRDRTGVHSDSEGLAPEALKHIQQSVMGQSMDLSRMKIEAIARIFAETGLKSLFLHLHELIMKHQDRKAVVKLRNQWMEIDPTAWRDRSDMTVQVGLGIGSREVNQLHLNAIASMQEKMVVNGGLGLTVTPRNIYNTAREYVKNANLKDPSLYFTDPGDQMPQQQQDPAQKAAAQAMLMQQQNDAKALQLKEQKQQQDFMLELRRLEETVNANNDKVLIAFEGFKNELLQIAMRDRQSGQ